MFWMRLKIAKTTTSLKLPKKEEKNGQKKDYIIKIDRQKTFGP